MVQSPIESLTLGTPIQRYEGGSSIFNLLSALLFAGAGIVFGIGAFPGNFLLPASTEFNLNFVLVGLFNLAIGAYGIYRWWSDIGIRVQVYTDGLERLQRNKTQEVRWDDITEVWESITEHEGELINLFRKRLVYQYTLQTADQRKLIFSNEIKGIEQLGKIIQQDVTKRLLPSAIAAYNTGQRVSFGAFTISKEGIEYDNKLLAWAEIEEAQVGSGYVGFKKQGKWLNWISAPSQLVPNLFVFLALVDHAIGLKGGR
jgi:hypothetical protein